jgi:hypothetical protein
VLYRDLGVVEQEADQLAAGLATAADN